MKQPLTLVIGMAAAVTALAIACGGENAASDRPGDSPTQAPAADRKIVPAPIDEFDLVIRESAPPQYAVRIVSGLPSGCAEWEATGVVGRSGDVITIEVTNKVPSDPNAICTQIYGMKETTAELGSDFVSGTEYTVKINDEELKFTAQ